MQTPNDGESVWVEYPEGKRFRAKFHAASNTFAPEQGVPIHIREVMNWSRQEHEDYDISDEPAAPEKGRLTRS